VKLGWAIASLALASGILASGGSAHAQGAVQIGTLTCNVSGGWGFVFGSSKALRCTFARAGGGPEHYGGSINKFGVDIGYTQGGVLLWGVFAPSANLAPGGLSGNYVGATGSATVSLQPLSIEGNTGLNVAAGIGAISLRYQPQVGHHYRP